MGTNNSTRPKTAKKSPVGRYKRDVSMACLRSAITNGSDLLAGDVDHRAAWVRRLRDLILAHTSDLGGADNISAAEQSIVRRASMLELQLELLETTFAENDGMASSHQLLLYQRTANSTRRLLEAVGLKRRAKDITTPHPLDYARQIDAEAEEVI